MTPPTTLLLGMVQGEWPIHAFTEEAQAMHWLRGAGSSRRRVWRVNVSDLVELRLVEPASYLEEL